MHPDKQFKGGGRHNEVVGVMVKISTHNNCQKGTGLSPFFMHKAGGFTAEETVATMKK